MDAPQMPVLFIGHGSPMNALAENEFAQLLGQLGSSLLPRPKAVLVVSAHWMTEGTWVTHMKEPRTIHDFYGFPESLFQVQYPAPGSPELAERVQHLLGSSKVQLDSSNWGLDHGTWSVLRHIYPEADVPIVQLSLDMSQPAEYHYELGKKLTPLRSEGVIIIGSGNLVHNLRQLNWADPAPPHPWAVQVDEWFENQILERNDRALVHEYEITEAQRLSVPTPDHYYPFLYVLGASDPKDEITFDIKGIHHASISMRSVRYAPAP